MKYLTAVTTALVVLLAGTTGLIGGEPAATAPADQAKVAEAVNRFAFDLYAKLKDQEGNLFLSPYSISTALAMTYAGARGQTADQMAEVLRLPVQTRIVPVRDGGPDVLGIKEQRWESSRLHGAYAALRNDLNTGGKEGAYELAVANRLWGQKGYGFLPDFLGLLKTHYGAGLEQVDFVGGTEAARQTINAWVERETRGKITDLLKPGTIGGVPPTYLVLTNAIYFKGKWAGEFDKDRTRDADFFVSAERKVSAPLMRKTDEFGYFEDADLQAVELPYKGDRLAMVVLLPRRKDGLADLEKSLTAERVAGIVTGLARRKVRVLLPRFKMTAEFRLKAALTALGMEDAFVPARADFSGMTGGRDLWIGLVAHKAFVEVNEEGTEAAAATGVVMPTEAITEPPPVFRADHPFLHLIRDRQSGAILFLGRLTDPTR